MLRPLILCNCNYEDSSVEDSSEDASEGPEARRDTEKELGVQVEKKRETELDPREER